LGVAKTIATLKVKLPLSGTITHKTMILTKKQKEIAFLFDENFWKRISGHFGCRIVKVRKKYLPKKKFLQLHLDEVFRKRDAWLSVTKTVDAVSTCSAKKATYKNADG
jgi:hypothetical protein